MSINGTQDVKLKNGFIKFKSSSKQISAPFRIHADFECLIKKVDKKAFNGCNTEKYQDRATCSFSYKAVCIDDTFTKPIVLYKGKNAAYVFIKMIPEEYNDCKKMIKTL